MRFTQGFFIPFSSHLPFLPTRSSNLFCFSNAEIKIARLRLLALNVRAWLETVAFTSSNWIPWSSVIYCFGLVLACGRIPIRTFEAGRWGTAISAWRFLLLRSLLPFPSHYSLSSQIAQSTLREDSQITFFVWFQSVIRGLGISTKSGIRADFPPSPGKTRTLRRARRRGVVSSYPRRIRFLRFY